MLWHNAEAAINRLPSLRCRLVFIPLGLLLTLLIRFFLNIIEFFIRWLVFRVLPVSKVIKLIGKLIRDLFVIKIECIVLLLFLFFLFGASSFA